MKPNVFGVLSQSMVLERKDLMQCKGGKKAKQRFTITLIANTAGSAIVVLKAEKPRIMF